MSGFANAPVTKGLMLSVGFSSLGVALLHWKPYLPLIFEPHITKYGQFWRLATQPLAFVNSSELFLWELLLYSTSRHVERCLGTRKFAAFLVLSHLLSTFLSFLALLVIHPLFLRSPSSLIVQALATSPWNTLHPGPTALAFSVLFLYKGIVPSIYTFDIFGFSWSDKIFPFVLASQLLSRHLPLLLPPLTGFLAAHILLLQPTSSTTRSASLLETYYPHLPLPLQRLSQAYLLPLLGSLREPKRSTNAWPQEPPPTVPASVALGLVATGAGFGAGAPASGLLRRAGWVDGERVQAARAAQTEQARLAQEATVERNLALAEQNRRANADPLLAATGTMLSEQAGTEAALRWAEEREATREGLRQRAEDRQRARDGLEPIVRVRDPVAASLENADVGVGVGEATPVAQPTSVVSQWVQQLTAGGAESRAPTEVEIAELQGMFPNSTRARIVQALQQSDFDQGRAVDALLVDDDT